MPFAPSRAVIIASIVAVAAVAIGSFVYFTRGKGGADPHSSNPNQRIIGAWVLEESPTPIGAMAFSEDGEVTNPFITDESLPKGHFKISGDTLTITMDGPDVGATLDFKFAFDGDNHLDLTMVKQKQTLHMRRVRPEEMEAIKQEMKGPSKGDPSGLIHMPVPESGPQTEESRATTCVSFVKQQTLGTMLYASDYDQSLPGEQWSTSLLPYIKTEAVFTCPSLKAAGQTGGFAFKSSLLGARTAQIPSPATETMIFEVAALGLNQSADIAQMLPAGRHDGKRSVGYADGHAKPLRDGELP